MRRVVGSLLSVALILSLVVVAVFDSSRKVAAQDAPSPELRKVRPDTITAGAPSFTMRVDGKSFVDGAKVMFDGADLGATRVSENGRLVLVEIAAARVAAPGAHMVKVVNPDAKETASTTFTVVERDPDIRVELEGNSLEEDLDTNIAARIRGDGFDERSTAVIWGADSANTRFISENVIEVEFDANFFQEPARIPVMVRNRGGRLSNVDLFFIVPRPASINSVEPFEVQAGTGDFDLAVFGDNFKDDATILIDGDAVATTHPKPDRLETKILASSIATPGLIVVRVEQEGIQSNDFTVTVAPDATPFIFMIGPSKVRLGEKKLVLDVFGANFKGGLLVLVDGEEADIKENFRRMLRAGVPKDLLSVLGTKTVQIRDKDGNLSNTATFDVVPDVTVSTLSGRDRDGFNQAAACVPGEQAMFRRPSRLVRAADGLLYVADQQNHAIRTVNIATGEVCTLAGRDIQGYNDSVNPRNFAPAFSNPLGVAVADDGVVFVTENGNHVIRRIRRQGAGIVVDTLAGVRFAVTDTERQDRTNATLRGVTGFRDGDGLTAEFRQPDDIIAAPDGSLLLSDTGNHSIRRITIIGDQVRVETLTGNGVPGFVDGDAANARFNTPTGIALTPDGKRLFVADTRNNRIRSVDLTTMKVSTFAGNGTAGSQDGPPTESTFNQPIGLAVDADGTVYVSESNGRKIRRIDPAGNVSTLTGDSTKLKFRDGPGVTATFKNLRGLAIDRSAGVLYVADYENSRIRRIALR